MNIDNNIYKRPTARVQGMSSRQQVLYLLQKTQKEANWDMENDSDFQDELSQETYQNTNDELQQPSKRRVLDSYSVPYNEELEIKREKMRQQEIKNHPERFRLLAYSLSQFTPIKKNKYLERKRHILLEKEANQLLVCNCQRSTIKKNEKTNPLQSFNCGERCINRCVSTECCVQTCPSGAFCKNRRFQLHQNAYVFPAKTEKKGWGLFAGEFIPKGTFIMQYVGEVFSVDSDLGQERVQQYRNSTCTYLMRTTNNEVIDPTYVGNIARFINHSCEPSCETQKWNVLGEVCVGIFALRDIQENEELSFDYQFDFFKTPFTKCYCGTSKCKGYLGVLSRNNEDDDEELENPLCVYCQDYINDKDDLVVCNGNCRETYHIICIIKKEGKTKTQAQALMQQSDRRNFLCRDCLTSLNIKKRKNKKLNREGEDSSQWQNDSNTLENPQEDKDDDNHDDNVLPWESKDPNVRKYYEDSKKNREIDKIIMREIDLIIQNMAEINELANQNSKMKRAKKKNSQFSDFYNFISELQKRLKMRSSGDKEHIKFRKHKDDIQESKRNKLQLLQSKKNLKLSKIDLEEVKKKRGRPRKIQSSQSFASHKEYIQPKLQQSQSAQFSKNDQIQSFSRKIMTIENDFLRSQSKKYIDQLSETENIRKINSMLSPSQLLIGDNKIEVDQTHDSFVSHEKEQDFQEDEGMEQDFDDEGEDDDQQDLDQIDEEEDDDDYFDEEDNDDNEDLDLSNVNNVELNLEKLQGLNEEEEEEKLQVRSGQDAHTGGSSKSFQTANNVINSQNFGKQSSIQSSLTNESILIKRLRQLSGEHDLLIGSDYLIKRTPIKQGLIFNQSPSKHSILQTGQSSNEIGYHREKFLVQNFIRIRIDEFLKEQLKNESNLTPSELIVRESKLNIYETVFNIVINDNIDTLQCIPTKFQIFWEQSWGGMVTVRLQSTLKQYIFITNLMQEVTDMLFKSNLLTQNSSTGYFIGQKLDLVSNKDVKSQFPFDIVLLKVPKNFIRKLVGYQEKTLTEYRKIFAVDFYFDRELLTDDVFHMHENTELRIFGKNQDVYAVNELVQKELEQIKMKTILLQMNDCKLLMDNVKEVKVLVDPCEIRVKRMMREWKDLRHPFYYLPNYFREMALIGKIQEIRDAELRIEQFFLSKRDMNYVNNQQISFLLPIYFKSISNEIKNQVSLRCPSIQLFFYEPTYPRKHLTVLMIGPWQALMQAKIILEEQANVYMFRNNHSFENFQQFTYHQQIRFSFKSLKRFVLEKDIKYLNHWDLCSIFLEDAGKEPVFEDLKKQLMSSQAEIQSYIMNPLLINQPQLQILSASQSFPVYPFSAQNQLFQQQQLMIQAQIEQKRQLIIMEKMKDYKALVDFLKNQDVETCINSLFVLHDYENAEESLSKLMNRLKVNKNELIQFMNVMLTRNVEDYEDSIRNFSSRYEQVRVIDQSQNDEEKLVIQQNRDSMKRYKNTYGDTQSYNRSRSHSYRQELNYHGRNDRDEGSYDRGYSNKNNQRIQPFNPDNYQNAQPRTEQKESRSSYYSRSKSKSRRRKQSYTSDRSSSDRGTNYRSSKYNRDHHSESPDNHRRYHDARISQNRHNRKRSDSRDYNRSYKDSTYNRSGYSQRGRDRDDSSHHYRKRDYEDSHQYNSNYHHRDRGRSSGSERSSNEYDNYNYRNSSHHNNRERERSRHGDYSSSRYNDQYQHQTHGPSSSHRYHDYNSSNHYNSYTKKYDDYSSYNRSSRHNYSSRRRSRSYRSASSERRYRSPSHYHRYRRRSRSYYGGHYRRSRSRYERHHRHHHHHYHKDPYHHVRALQNANRVKHKGGFDYGQMSSNFGVPIQNQAYGNDQSFANHQSNASQQNQNQTYSNMMRQQNQYASGFGNYSSNYRNSNSNLNEEGQL
ncbi:set domain containing protein [Stylonychia lemnae]|uniref:Set domain containing protein n=1 Tax=Stylonychia lemnae TaxID=5949 RepID=A0A077ZXM4_STYLE|nr:set domain containing protein [Stylonychia lemnae]|eukprot:CDW74666.1 set domain containing protein [Stylonychia lemnae]